MQPQKFEQTHTVRPEEIDLMGHVNNKIYLGWMEQIAIAHAQAVGLTFDVQQQHGKVLLAKQHVMNFTHPCFEGDDILLTSWIGEQVGCCQRKRHYEFKRLADQKVVFTGETTWVCVDAKTHRPTKLPQNYIDAYLKTDSSGSTD